MKKTITLLILISIIIACSPKALYPRLGWLVPWYIDDYISLNHSQSSQVRSRLEQQLDWHCRTQLPQYAEFLRNIHQDVDSNNQPLTIERLKEYNDRLSQYWHGLLEQISPDIIDILVNATDEQIAELFDNLESKNRVKVSEYVELPEQRIIQNRQKRMQKRLNYWFSDLTDSQKQAVAEWSSQLEPIAADWIAHRRKIQSAARQLLNHRNDSDQFKSELHELIVNSRELRTDDYQRRIDTNTERTLTLLADVSNTLEPEQKTHFSNRLQSLASELDTLSCDPAVVHIPLPTGPV